MRAVHRHVAEHRRVIQRLAAFLAFQIITAQRVSTNRADFGTLAPLVDDIVDTFGLALLQSAIDGARRCPGRVSWRCHAASISSCLLTS